MTAEELFKAGRVTECLPRLQAELRDHPADVKRRIFLFQLLSVLGDWTRAGTQLKVLADMDSGSLLMVNIFQPILLCERIRHDVFAGKRTPLIFGEPPAWIGSLVQAVGLFGQGRNQAGRELRDAAFADAPTLPGKVNGALFTWLADADERLGPVLELFLEGRYYWVPFERIRRIVAEPVTDLRDLVWLPVQLTWANGGQSAGHVPTRYVGTEQSRDDSSRLAKKTDWVDQDGILVGRGQRILATDETEYPLLEIREIEFEPPAPNPV
ncbi:MAG: virulence protein SciE type [Verrucomicrobia bacterium]|nr:virulence protein SciE type [Verrucomicrobiota bacterium]